MNENSDLKIPNPLHSYSGLFCIINSNIINSLIILLVFIIIEFGPHVLISHIKRFRMSQNRALN